MRHLTPNRTCCSRLLVLHVLTVLTLVSGSVQSSRAGNNTLGATPPLGWSTWNYFASEINETVVLEIADAMITTGLKAVGYEYVNIDAGYLLHDRDNTTGLY